MKRKTTWSKPETELEVLEVPELFPNEPRKLNKPSLGLIIPLLTASVSACCVSFLFKL